MSYGFLSCHILCVVFQKKNANNSCSYMKNTWVSLCSEFTRTKSCAHLRRTQIGTSLSHHPLFCRFFCSHSNLRAVKKSSSVRERSFCEVLLILHWQVFRQTVRNLYTNFPCHWTRGNRLVAGIPVDMVGGTSMGSFVGAAYAESADVNKMCQKVREWSLVRAGHTSYMPVTWSSFVRVLCYLSVSVARCVLSRKCSRLTKGIVIFRLAQQNV